MTIKIALNGAAGAMGRRVTALAAADNDVQLVQALEYESHPDLGKDIGVLAGVGECGVALSAEMSGGADVLVDFSSPEATIERALACGEAGIAVLACATGLSPEQRQILLGDVAAKVPVMHPSNTSLGVNLLFKLARQVTAALGAGYDIEIVEAHHRRKKDSPSGTAKELARGICEARGVDPDEVLVYGREGICGPRSDAEISVLAVRGGDIVGEHTVIYAGQGERLELTHRASSRDVFATGALRAAKFLAGKPAGVYTMSDVVE